MSNPTSSHVALNERVSVVEIDAPAIARRTRSRERLARALQGQGLLLMLAAVVVYFSFKSQYFLTGSNFVTIGSTSAALGIMAVAQTFLIVSGGMDLSVGSVVAFTSVTLGLLINHQWTFWPAALAACLVGAAVGAVNAILVVGLKINAFIATLATMSIFSGLAFTMTSGQTEVVSDKELTYIALNKVVGLPVPLIIFLVVLIAAAVVERFTSWGRTVYAIGGNAEAARLSGLHVRVTQSLLFVLSGLSAGVAGVLVTAQLASASPQVGATYLLSVITAVILGGASLSGGRGTVLGTFVAVIILGVLADGFALLSWSNSAQTIALGAALVIAVLLDQATRRLRSQR